MKTQHTPGPWITEPFRCNNFNQHAIDITSVKAFVYNFATVYSGADSTDEPFYLEAEANAKLIAASPELLSALKSCVMSMQAHPDCEPNSEFETFVNKGWEAIKKATGE